MATVSIVYTAITAPVENVAQICSIFVPTNAACDNAAFTGTYYDTNVDGFGEGTPIEAFVANSIAHPGLILSLKRAMKDGTYSYDVDDPAEIAYIEEVADPLADQGFTITVA